MEIHIKPPALAPTDETSDDADAGANTPSRLSHQDLESTFGKPGEIVARVVSGMDKAEVSGQERQVPRPCAVRGQDLEAPRFKKIGHAAQSPTSTRPTHQSPAFGFQGPRDHRDHRD